MNGSSLITLDETINNTYMTDEANMDDSTSKISVKMKHVCHVCNKGFKVPIYLREHMTTHTGERPFKCPECDATFARKRSLKYHLGAHQRNSLVRKQSSKKPAPSTKNKEELKCKFCFKYFNLPSALKIHMTKHTGERPFKCDICEKAFGQKGNLKNHMRIHTGELPFECKFCNRGFAESSNLRCHTLDMHTGEIKNDESHPLYKKLYKRLLKGLERPHCCKVCQKKFKRGSHLKEHLRLHTGENPYKCDSCAQQFRTLADKQKHMIKMHDLDKIQLPHSCTICDKVFPTSRSLRRHMSVHTGELPHQCTMCDKQYFVKSLLLEHLCTHTGERPYKCDVCTKGFIRISDFNKHKRIHTGETPYKCKICDAGFKQSGQLKLHMQRRHE